MNKLTLTIELDDRISVKKVIEGLRMFKGVKKVSVESEASQALSEARAGKTIRVKTVSELKDSLNS
ncbi:hypothetical protein [Bacteroides sp. 519]|uniref:hypothetical protein n=1 Tax=Bacteroides sp. 519 TaxID=2302937 RepID=UPI0013CFA9BB|nr:hypothetical protein [Bacteroides sp. 519]